MICWHESLSLYVRHITTWKIYIYPITKSLYSGDPRFLIPNLLCRKRNTLMGTNCAPLQFHTIFALYGKETFSISVQSHLQVHRWCIVHKQPRIRKLSGPDVSCWTWDQGHHREHHFCFLPRFTSVDWEGWSTSHFHLRQARWFQFPHHKLSVPE